MKIQNANEAEEYVVKHLGIPFVNFKGINLDIVREIIVALESVFNEFPALKNSICAIGKPIDIEYQMTLLYHSSKMHQEQFIEHGSIPFEDIFDERVENIAKAYIYGDSTGAIIYTGIQLNGWQDKNITLEKFDNYYRRRNAEGYTPTNCNRSKNIIVHEIGHLMEWILKLRAKPKFKLLIENVDIEREISGCAAVSEDEIIPEAFARLLVHRWRTK